MQNSQLAKKLAIAGSSVALVLALTACGDDDDNGNEAVPETDPPVEEEAPPVDPPVEDDGVDPGDGVDPPGDTDIDEE